MAGLRAPGLVPRGAITTLLHEVRQIPGLVKEGPKDMTRNRTLFQRMAGLWDAFRSAGHAADAVRRDRSPAPSDLERLGISVIAFGAINKN